MPFPNGAQYGFVAKDGLVVHLREGDAVLTARQTRELIKRGKIKPTKLSKGHQPR